MARANPNRWGHTFKKGDPVRVQGARGSYIARFVKMAPRSSFSAAYGRQAIVAGPNGPLTADEGWEVGYDDLSPAGGVSGLGAQAGPATAIPATAIPLSVADRRLLNNLPWASKPRTVQEVAYNKRTHVPDTPQMRAIVAQLPVFSPDELWGARWGGWPLAFFTKTNVPQFFVLDNVWASFLVDTQGARYARYMAAIPWLRAGAAQGSVAGLGAASFLTGCIGRPHGGGRHGGRLRGPGSMGPFVPRGPWPRPFPR